MQKLSQKTQGIVYVLIAAFGFSLMSMFIKLAGDLPSFEKAFFRNFVALIFITILMLRSRTSFRPERRNLPALFGRCFFGTLGLLCNFYAIGKLNLPDANMLNKLSPFFAILFSIFLLREKPNLVQVLGVLVAFGGSVCIIKPSFDNPQMLPALAGVLGGLGAGAAYTFVRYLGARGENGSRIVFYFSAFSCIVCVPFVALDYAPMSLLQLVYLLLAGAFACVGQLGITKAYVCAPAREISVYDYTQVLFAAAFSSLVMCRTGSASWAMCSSAAQASACFSIIGGTTLPIPEKIGRRRMHGHPAPTFFAFFITAGKSVEQRIPPGSLCRKRLVRYNLVIRNEGKGRCILCIWQMRCSRRRSPV